MFLYFISLEIMHTLKKNMKILRHKSDVEDIGLFQIVFF